MRWLLLNVLDFSNLNFFRCHINCVLRRSVCWLMRVKILRDLKQGGEWISGAVYAARQMIQLRNIRNSVFLSSLISATTILGGTQSWWFLNPRAQNEVNAVIWLKPSSHALGWQWGVTCLTMLAQAQKVPMCWRLRSWTGLPDHAREWRRTWHMCHGEKCSDVAIRFKPRSIQMIPETSLIDAYDGIAVGYVAVCCCWLWLVPSL